MMLVPSKCNSLYSYHLGSGRAEFAYYLTRVAQESEAKAIKEKLNTEQKLRNALDRVKISDKKRQESEELARIAAERSEQVIREKQEAEEAARTIDQRTIQEKLKAEEAAHIAAERSEQAVRERQEAGEAARIAADECEQAIREKQKAEEVARIAVDEREQARRREKDLSNAIEEEIEKATRELENKVEFLQREVDNLRSENNSHQLEARNRNSRIKLQNEGDFISFKITENNFYSFEIRDLIFDILSKNCDNVHDKSRRHHVLQDLVKNNSFTSKREHLKAEIQNLFRDYTRMNAYIRSSLEQMGFEIISEKNHYKIKFCRDNRYIFAFSKTPSDYRSGMNIARDICNLLL